MLLGQHTCYFEQDLVAVAPCSSGHCVQTDGEGSGSPLYLAPRVPAGPVSGEAGCCPSAPSLPRTPSRSAAAHLPPSSVTRSSSSTRPPLPHGCALPRAGAAVPAGRTRSAARRLGGCGELRPGSRVGRAGRGADGARRLPPAGHPRCPGSAGRALAAPRWQCLRLAAPSCESCGLPVGVSALLAFACHRESLRKAIPVHQHLWPRLGLRQLRSATDFHSFKNSFHRVSNGRGVSLFQPPGILPDRHRYSLPNHWFPSGCCFPSPNLSSVTERFWHCGDSFFPCGLTVRAGISEELASRVVPPSCSDTSYHHFPCT